MHKTYTTGIESQNHKVAETGRDLWSAGPTLLLRTTENQLPRTISRQILSISRDGESITFLGNMFKCLVTLTVEKHFQSAVFAHCLLYYDRALLKRAWFDSLCAISSGIYIHLTISLSFLFSKLNSSGCVSLSSFEKCLIILVAFRLNITTMSTSLALGCQELQLWPHQC